MTEQKSRYTLWSAASILQRGFSLTDKETFTDILQLNAGRTAQDVLDTEWLHFLNRPLDYPFRRNKDKDGNPILDDIGRDLIDVAKKLGKPPKVVVKRSTKRTKASTKS